METFHLTDDLNVMGVQVKNIPSGIGEAFDALVKKIPDGFNRSYYGISEMTGDGMVYRAAAIEKYDGEAEQYQYERYKVEKGKYLTVTVKDWRSKVGSINKVFHEMMRDVRADRTKPCVEWYKNDDEMMCMVRATG